MNERNLNILKKLRAKGMLSDKRREIFLDMLNGGNNDYSTDR